MRGRDIICGVQMMASHLRSDLKRTIWAAFSFIQKNGNGASLWSQDLLAAEAQAISRLNQAGSRLWQVQSLSQGLQEMLLATIELLGADMGNVQILDAERGALRIVAQQGFDDDFLGFFEEVSTKDECACGRTLRTGRMTVIEDVERDTAYAPFRAIARSAGYRAVVSMPLLGYRDKPLGVLSAHFRRPHRPATLDIERLALYGQLAARFVERWQSEEAALRENEERLRLALDAGKLATWDWNLATGATVWNAQHYHLLGYQAEYTQASYDNWAARVHPDDYACVVSVYQAAMHNHKEFASSYRLMQPDGALRWCTIRGRFFYETDGRPVRMIAIVDDITERRRIDEAQRVLVSELQHRTRNLLTVVQSIALQTLEMTSTREDFESGFIDRLLSLARVQGLLSRESRVPVTLGGLLKMELDAFCSEADYRKVTLSGPEVKLKSSLAQALALGIHELTTNALKYGALARFCEEGRLRVTWHFEGEGDERCLILEWREAPLAAPPRETVSKAHGYGRTLIEEDLPYSLSAQTKLELTADALHCWISIPLGCDTEQEVQA